MSAAARSTKTPPEWESALQALLASGTEAGRQRRSFLLSLRAARAQVQNDAEGFESIVFEIERLGRHLVPRSKTLNAYADPLSDLVRRQLGSDRAGRFAQRLFVLRHSRNDNAHGGAHARHAAQEAVDVALDLEEALTVSWPGVEAGNLMSEGVTTVEAWQTLREVRRLMLKHAFTSIPVCHEGRWYLITDQWLAAQLEGKGRRDRDHVYERKVGSVVAGAKGLKEVRLLRHSTRLGEAQLSKRLKRGLILVGDGRRPQNLIGVISAADPPILTIAS